MIIKFLWGAFDAFTGLRSGLQAIILGVAVSGLAGVGGYVYGRMDGKALCAARAAEQAAIIREFDLAEQAKQDAATLKEIQEAAKNESANDATELAMPSAGDRPCLSGKWLRDFAKLK